MYGKELVVCVKYTSGNSSSNCELNVNWKVEHQITEAELRGHDQWQGDLGGNCSNRALHGAEHTQRST